VAPSRSTYSWPSGNRRRTRCAACTAREVLPSPPAPATTAMRTAPGSPLPPGPDSRAHRCFTCSPRPVKSAMSAGSCAGAGAARRAARDARGSAGPGGYGGRESPVPGMRPPGGKHRPPGDKHSACRAGTVLGQQLGVELAQLGTGVDAQLPGDGVPGLPVDLERLGVPPGTVQRPHQQQPQPFPQRLVRQQPAQLGDGLIVAATGEFGRDPQFDGTEAKFAEPFGLRFDEWRRRDVGQRPAVPQGEGLGEPAGRPLGIPGGERPPAVAHHGLKPQRVGVVRGHLEPVAGSAGDQQAPVRVAHQAAQPQHVDADQVGRPGRRAVPPDLVDQGVGGDDLPRVDQQRPQHGTPLGGPDPPPVFPGPDLKRPEQTEPHHYPGSLASG